MYYQRNAKAAETHTVGDTKTDQSGADQTDINVIVRNLKITGTAPGSSQQPIYADFSSLPDNLRDMIELGRSVEGHRQQLPPALREMTVEELLNSTPAQLAQRIQTEEEYGNRHKRLPDNLKSLSKNDIMKMTEKEFSDMIKPATPAPTPAPETK